MLEQTDLKKLLEEYKEPQPNDVNMGATKEAIRLLITAFKTEKELAGDKESPQVTASYSILPPSFGNEFHSSTESAALDNVENFEKACYFRDIINQGLNKIDCVIDPVRKTRRRTIFVESYILGKRPEDIMERHAIEKTTYYEDYKMATIHFAIELGLLVKRKNGGKRTEKKNGLS